MSDSAHIASEGSSLREIVTEEKATALSSGTVKDAASQSLSTLKETESAAGERKGAASKAAPKKAARISTATNCPSGARGAAAAALAGEKREGGRQGRKGIGLQEGQGRSGGREGSLVQEGRRRGRRPGRTRRAGLRTGIRRSRAGSLHEGDRRCRIVCARAAIGHPRGNPRVHLRRARHIADRERDLRLLGERGQQAGHGRASALHHLRDGGGGPCGVPLSEASFSRLRSTSMPSARVAAARSVSESDRVK